MRWWEQYGKAIIAAVGMVLTSAQVALNDGRVTPAEWVQVGIAAATAVLVYVVPVSSHSRFGKSAVGVVLPLLNAVSAVLLQGWRGGSVAEAILAFLTMVFVRYAPSVSVGGVAAE